MSFNSWAEVREILKEISFNDWEFYVRPMAAPVSKDYLGRDLSVEDPEWPHFLQIQFMAPDLVSGEPERQYCRKWQLSLHMTVSEIVYTAFKAVLAALEHEAREQFRFRGASCLGPHVDVEQLVELTCKSSGHDHRTGVWVKDKVGAS